MTQDEADVATAHLSYVNAMADASDADWVVEAATENIEVKKSIFTQMFETFGKDVVLATNTSSISITDLASVIPDAASRVIGMHFFNPVPVMKLVEVIKGKETSSETTRSTLELAERMGENSCSSKRQGGLCFKSCSHANDQRSVPCLGGWRCRTRRHRFDYGTRLRVPNGSASPCRLYWS